MNPVTPEKVAKSNAERQRAFRARKRLEALRRHPILKSAEVRAEMLTMLVAIARENFSRGRKGHMQALAAADRVLRAIDAAPPEAENAQMMSAEMARTVLAADPTLRQMVLEEARRLPPHEGTAQ